MKIRLEKWTKTRTVVEEDYEAIKRIRRSEFKAISAVLEIIRCVLDKGMNSSLSSMGWLLSEENDIELLKNKLSTEFIDWKNLRPLVWVTSAVNPSSNTDIRLKIRVDKLEIFIVDNTLITDVKEQKSSPSKKRKDRIASILAQKFQHQTVNDMLYKGGNLSTLVKLNVSNTRSGFMSVIDRIEKSVRRDNAYSGYEAFLPLSQSSSLSFIPEIGLPRDDVLETGTTKQDLDKDKKIIQNFNNKIKEIIKEEIRIDEKFLYVLCINANIHFEGYNDCSSEVVYEEEHDLEFFENMREQVALLLKD